MSDPMVVGRAYPAQRAPSPSEGFQTAFDFKPSFEPSLGIAKLRFDRKVDPLWIRREDAIDLAKSLLRNAGVDFSIHAPS